MSIERVALHETTRERYLNYALSVITSRALPDVRDGLKPVQRRILYAMFHDLKLSADSRFRKCAAVIGEVMGKYHPHGDQAIYDALVRMAQPWSLRYPLVAGQGNFGSLDGDNAAAMRYTEARLDRVAAELLDEIKKDTVDFRDNFEGTYREPGVLPAQIPNLLVNGSQGIAVGMATNIPPHNLGEVIDALVALIDAPELSVAELLTHVPGPDFPTGGRITTAPEEICAVYERGSGTLEIRGDVTLERGEGRRYLVITSIPYGVNKAALVEAIAEHIVAGKVPQIIDVRDESTDAVRVVCELKRGADPEVASAYLFKHTALRSRFHVNLTALVPAGQGSWGRSRRADSREPVAGGGAVDGAESSAEGEEGSASSAETESGERLVPRRLNLKEMLRAFLDFRFAVVTRRLRFDLRTLEARIHILEGLARVFDALDEAIALIREAEDRADARVRLRARFELSEVQAEAVLEIRLYRLARLEIQAILEELAEKEQQAARIRRLLRGKRARWELVRTELAELDRLYRDPRRTALDAGATAEEAAYREDAYLVDEDARVIVTRDGWVKRQKSYTDLAAIRVREGDAVQWAYPARTKEVVLFFSNRGRVYTARVSELPQTSGYGEPVHRRFDLADGEVLVGVVVSDPRALPSVTPEELEAARAEELPPPPYVVAVTRGGSCLRLSVAAFSEPSNRKGRVYVRLDPGVPDDAVVRVLVSEECDEETIAVATVGGRAILFYVDEIKVLRGPGRGVRAIKLESYDRVLDFALATRARDGLTVQTPRGRLEIIRATKYAATRRGGKGRPVVKRGKLSACPWEPIEVRVDGSDDGGNGANRGGDGKQSDDGGDDGGGTGDGAHAGTEGVGVEAEPEVGGMVAEEERESVEAADDDQLDLGLE